MASPSRTCANGLRSRREERHDGDDIRTSGATLAQRVLGLTSRELSRAAPLFAYLFLIMAGSVASKAARDALFLDRFRAIDLPYVDIAIAVIVGLVAGMYIRAGERTNLRNVQIGSLLAFAASADRVLVARRRAAASRPSRRAVRRHLHLGRRPQRARAVAGLDAGQLRDDHARGEAGVRLHRRRRHSRAGLSAASPRARSSCASAPRARCCGWRSTLVIVGGAGLAHLARPPGVCRRRRRHAGSTRRADAKPPARELRAGAQLALSHGDRARHLAGGAS